MSTEITTKQSFDLSPQTLGEAMEFSKLLAESTIVPKDFIGRPGNVLVAIQWGMEIGLKPMQAMQNIAVINGRPSLWGDAMLALVLSSPFCEDVIETYEGSGDDFAAVCVAKRKGKEDKVGRFSLANAKAAGLLGKQGPWQQYRDRMMKMRARGFALRDQFPDVLKGIVATEELMDLPPEKDMGDASVVQRPAANAKPAALAPSAELLNAAKDAAAGGVAAYQEFWKNTGAPNRKLLAGEHEGFKTRAAAVDTNRTLDNTASQASPAGEQRSGAMEALLADLYAAADGGVDAFNSAWESLSPETQDALSGELTQLAAKAKQVEEAK